MMDPHYFGVSKEIEDWAAKAVDSIDYAKLAPRVVPPLRRMNSTESDPVLADQEIVEALMADARFMREMQESPCEYCEAHREVVESQERALEWLRQDRDTLMGRHRNLQCAFWVMLWVFVMAGCVVGWLNW